MFSTLTEFRLHTYLDKKQEACQLAASLVETHWSDNKRTDWYMWIGADEYVEVPPII